MPPTFHGRRYPTLRRGLALGAMCAAVTGCLDDTPVSAGAPTVRASLSASVVGAAAGSTVRFRVGYRRQSRQLVTLPASPDAIAVTPGTTVVVPLTVDIAPCLADSDRLPVGEPGCLLTIELTLTDAGGGVVDTQTRDAEGDPASPGELVNFGTITVGVVVADVSVSPRSATLNVNGEQQLTATVRDDAGAVITTTPVSWTTSGASIAQLSANTGGTITVRALALGTATVTATAGGKASPPVTISVVPPAPLTIRQRQGDGCAIVGQTLDLLVDNPPGAVTWSSAHTAIATVGASSGVITGIGPGSATITATSGARSGTFSVCVTAPPAVSPTTISLVAGRSLQLTITGGSGGTLSLSSSAPAIAVVDAAGLVRGVGVGEATIAVTLTAASGTATATSAVTVAPARVAVTPASGSATLGKALRYTASVFDVAGNALPSVAADWSVGDASVAGLSATRGASVDVTALRLGTTTVRAVVSGVAGSAQFTATQPLPAVRLEKVSGDGATCPTFSNQCTFTVRAVDVDGAAVAGATVVWSSSFGCGTPFNVTTDAQGLAVSNNLCSEVPAGTYGQVATLQGTQAQASFTYVLRGLVLTYQSTDSYGYPIYSVTSPEPATGLAAKVVYRSGPTTGYVTDLVLDKPSTPTLLTVQLGGGLEYGYYVLDIIVSTTTPGLGPGIYTVEFFYQGGYSIQPNVQAPALRLVPRTTSAPSRSP